MNSFSIVTEARSLYPMLHQSTEMNDALEFIDGKNLSGFIEVGSANGASFHCWGRAIPTGPKISVDWNFGFGLAVQNVGDTVAHEADHQTIQIRNDTWRTNFADVHTVEGDSRSPDTIEQVRKILNGQTVDWVFIDAWHEYDAAMADYKNYLEFVSPNGYITFHDIFQSDSMKQFWHEVKGLHQTALEFYGGTGMGVLSRT
jgi:cephalosporin hydroxylase